MSYRGHLNSANLQAVLLPWCKPYSKVIKGNFFFVCVGSRCVQVSNSFFLLVVFLLLLFFSSFVLLQPSTDAELAKGTDDRTRHFIRSKKERVPHAITTSPIRLLHP
ncbi:hypothetical protein, unlikely [Trypanosoma brucei gambiense DAL972]|uniref:Uncharacterized protein n=1 Tax=Trypanosoma brucei gambiense (strain MHOM/CI/86/DAL972) TaxID=679716 RepID=D0A143_TRYB9|nr:hypothetical protein, unlikely [Trypanosoma brucei gambiense DAL972]CBH14985.1 hypothetical protein, unlikely [Trypanosoma brucei gambiense DAL972]|eukprot:XP_011777251.1 hypothetical protein, unlikely [Trypanosoma brucei gambiense DAL972]